MYNLYDKLTPEYILSRVKEEKVYEKYLQLRPEIGPQYRNPLRTDVHPTCTFARINNKLVFRDWSEPLYMDIFDIVQKKFGIGFNEALHKIAQDFDITPDSPVIRHVPDRQHSYKRRKPHFEVAVCPLKSFHLSYLEQFGITADIAHRFNVFGIKNLWVNGKLRYRYSEYDPAIGYYFGINSRNRAKWKIYFYRRKNKRFMGNTSRFNGWAQLPETATVLIITKSLKDIMTLHRLGLAATGPQGESVHIRKEAMQQLRQRFSYIYSLFDFDRTGIQAALRLRDEYRVEPLFLTNGMYGSKDYGSKDISDLVRDQGLAYARHLKDQFIDHILHGTGTNHNDSTFSPPV